MGKPMGPKDVEGGGVFNLLLRARMELSSASSSLYMMPDPIPASEQQEDNNGFLSDTDYGVRHSLEHIHALALFLNKIQFDLEDYRDSFLREPFDLAAYERVNAVLGRYGG